MRSSILRAATFPGLAALFIGCGRLPAKQAPTPGASPGQRIITAQEIQRTGATSAWQALQYTVPFYRFNVNGTVRHRAQQSILLHDRPKILVDGIDLTEFGVLMQMPASDLQSIVVLDGKTATTFYGTNSGSGVILLNTKNGG